MRLPTSTLVLMVACRLVLAVLTLDAIRLVRVEDVFEMRALVALAVVAWVSERLL